MATDINSTDGRKRRKAQRPPRAVGRPVDPNRSADSRRQMLYKHWKHPELYGRKLGQWDGMSKEECARVNAEAKAFAKRTIEKMKDNGTISPEDDPRAVQALETAVEIMKTGANQGTKLSAAKLILEYTKSKPVAKSEVTVNKAEEWLASIAGDDDSDDDGVPAENAETPP